MAEQERQRLAKAQATKYAQHQAAVTASSGEQAGAASQGSEQPQASSRQEESDLPPDSASMLMNIDAEGTTVSDVTSPAGQPDATGRKRRRTAVDYVALNKQLEAEATASFGQSSLQQSSKPAEGPLSFVTDVPADAVGVLATNTVPNQRPDVPMDDSALTVVQQDGHAQQPREGDKLV